MQTRVSELSIQIPSHIRWVALCYSTITHRLRRSVFYSEMSPVSLQPWVSQRQLRNTTDTRSVRPGWRSVPIGSRELATSSLCSWQNSSILYCELTIEKHLKVDGGDDVPDQSFSCPRTKMEHGTKDPFWLFYPNTPTDNLKAEKHHCIHLYVLLLFSV